MLDRLESFFLWRKGEGAVSTRERYDCRLAQQPRPHRKL